MPTSSSPSAAIDIIYAAHTASCTFLLDSEGICRRIVVAPKGKRSAGRTAARCVGAQYVASLDGSAAGGLVEMPRVGAAMLFARVDERGRVSLVRTGTVISFESNAAEDPFVEGASGAVQTSAPELEDAAPYSARNPIPAAAAVDEDVDYYDASERTQRIQALRPEDIAAALGDAEDDELEQGNDLATAEYRSVDVEHQLASRRTPPTLRAAPRDASLDDEDEYARPAAPVAPPAPSPTPSRGVLPRRSEAHAAVRSYAPVALPTPSSDVQLSRRRRGT